MHGLYALLRAEDHELNAYGGVRSWGLPVELLACVGPTILREALPRSRLSEGKGLLSQSGRRRRCRTARALKPIGRGGRGWRCVHTRSRCMVVRADEAGGT